MESTTSRLRALNGGRIPFLQDFELSEGPPDRLSPLKSTGFCHKKGTQTSQVIQSIYSNEVTWLKPKDSKIYFEVPNTFLTRLITPDSGSQQNKNISIAKIENNKCSSNDTAVFKSKYQTHLCGWKEYQFNRHKNSTILGEEASILLRKSGAFQSTPSSPTKDSLWTVDSVQRGCRKKQFKHPIIGKAFRETTIPEPKNFVVKSISKARKCFPKRDQNIPYTESEMRLFENPLSFPLLKKYVKPNGTWGTLLESRKASY